MPTVTLKHFDNEGAIVDAHTIELSEEALTDLIDQAANVILARRQGRGEIEATLDELEGVLVLYDVLDAKRIPG